MSPLLLLLIAATPTAEPADLWVGASPQPVTAVRYNQTPAAAPATPAAPDTAPGAFAKRVLALEIALSTIVAERPTLWRLDRLEAEASTLLSRAPTEADRRAVRDIADRIDRFARIAAQHRRQRDAGGWRAPSQQTPAAGSTLPSTGRLAPPVRLTKSPAQRASPHDAEGVLRPVVSKRANAPKYAIIDDRGKLTTLVTPQPEVTEQFEKLVGQRVGLKGRRSFLTDLRRQHLVAERVTPLPTTRR